MEIKREWLEELIFEGEASRRFTQDSPVLPDVWIRYGMKLTRGEEPVLDLLLTPHSDSTAGALYDAIVPRVEHERREGGLWKRLRDPRGKFQKILGAAKKRVVTPQDEASREDTPCDPEWPNLAYNQSTVAACLHLVEVIRILLPLTQWWRRNVCRPPGRDTVADLYSEEGRKAIEDDLERLREGKGEKGGPVDLLWLVKVVGSMLAAADASEPKKKTWEARRSRWKELLEDEDDLARRFREFVLDDARVADVACPDLPEDTPLFMVSRNRRAKATVSFSVQAVKADAARRVFEASCAQLAWAILDSGIDATHPAFRKRSGNTVLGSPFRDERGRPGNGSRVDATFDFTRIRLLLSGSAKQLRAEAERIAGEVGRIDASLAQLREQRAGRPAADPDLEGRIRLEERRRAALDVRRQQWERYADGAADRSKDLKKSLLTGRAINWEDVREVLKIPHDEESYVPPVHEHGTHVAGILAADWQADDWEKGKDPEYTPEDLRGTCPDIHLYDFRVFDDNGNGDEFSVMAALQFLRHLNAHRERPLIHGANLSLAIRHDVANFACGRTPVCDECERVVNSGVVVVAAAGNYGYHRFATVTDSGVASAYEGYADISITDPGNADAVITVGSTHRIEPHTYGVSYFSSRGPTGDGRYKPDLVAPGEKIKAPVPGMHAKVKDGTSMAAPHVSGAAALVMARYSEFIGRPARIKQILCSTATDLGRDRYFQGAGMLDILRALQSV